MLSRSRVFLWCLLAGCAGGPITDFPDKSTGEESGGGAPPVLSEGDGDGAEVVPPINTGDDGDESSEFGDGDTSNSAGDAGTPHDFPDRPCGVAVPDGGAPDEGDGGVCSGQQCPITRSELQQLAVPGGVCASSAAVDLVCDGKIQSSIATCNESSLQESAGFGLVENCVLTDPAVSSASEACIGCYLDANRCVLLNCLAECLVPTTADACSACRTTHCGAALRTCTGLPPL